MTILGHLEQHPGLDPPDFTATVEAIATGHENWVELDKTFYYPMGGGQPADRGIMKADSFECNVLDVRKHRVIEAYPESKLVLETGEEIRHYFDSPIGTLELGDEIHCSIDTIWRNQLSKMHTAQHLISALAHEEWGANTVGNQIGDKKTRIDLEFQSRDVFDAEYLQQLVNDTIKQDLEVTMDFRPSDELLDDPLVRVNMSRMPPNIDVWRTISIGELDVCPCAGTHVPSTGLIPEIEITRVKSKGAGRLRIEYLLNNQ